MKHIFTLILCNSFLFNALSKDIVYFENGLSDIKTTKTVEKVDNYYIVKYDFNGLEVDSRQNNDFISIDGCTHYNIKGEPYLPIFNDILVLENDITNIEIVDSSFIEINYKTMMMMR